MQIKWLGHASFLITSANGEKIITDPYKTGGGIKYKPLNESADIVTQSHGHNDHNNAGAIKNHPVILTEAGTHTAKGITLKAIPVFHDEAQGSQRGENLIFCFEIDGIRLCHLGDLGHILDKQLMMDIGPVDVLFIPTGGYYTIDPAQASTVVQEMNPRLVFPMHYKTSRADYPIAGVEDFLRGKKQVRRLDSSEIDIKKEDLPEQTEIVVLQPAY